jgi:hypothetical protein
MLGKWLNRAILDMSLNLDFATSIRRVNGGEAVPELCASLLVKLP